MLVIYFAVISLESSPQTLGIWQTFCESRMHLDACKMLADDHLLFYHPDAPAVLSTGAGRHWPHGRGRCLRWLLELVAILS